MRRVWIMAAVLVVAGTAAGPARAGVYFTTGTLLREFAKPDDPDAQELLPQPGPFNQFQQDLAGYRAAAVELPNRVGAAVWSLTGDACPSTSIVPLSVISSLVAHKELPPADRTLGMHYLRRAGELERRDARGLLSLDDRINLGAYYIRLGNYPRAIAVLEKAQTSRHFMLRANLATAHELAAVAPGDRAAEQARAHLDRAVLYRQLALSSWPASYPGWNTMQVNFYRKAEQYHLTLLQLRQEEAGQRSNQAGLRLDPLFPRLKFVGPHSEYEAGGIAPAQWGEMPYDAGPLVMQLLLWLPFDDRLHWLLGELLNANGDVAGAAAMMKPVVNKPQDARKWDAGAPPELREHYRIVTEATEARRKEAEAVMTVGDQYLNLKLLCALAPRGMGFGAGDLLGEASWPAIVIASAPPPPKAEAQATAPTPAPASTTWLPNWRQVGVGFAAGAVVAWLLGYQIRQARLGKG